MGGLVGRSFDAPDEVRTLKDDMGKIELINVPGGVVGRATFQPGWRWSEHVKPVAGTESCQAGHVGYMVSGRTAVHMDDGSEMEFGPGDFVSIPPGHDGWTVGEEPAVMIDWQGMGDYATS
jgi:quercetin dioxygenase-like cupin family protein